jgi:hypothetical protein
MQGKIFAIKVQLTYNYAGQNIRDQSPVNI